MTVATLTPMNYLDRLAVKLNALPKVAAVASFARSTNLLVHVAFLTLIAYSLYGTGICCDDFWIIANLERDMPFAFLLANPVNIVTHWIFFPWAGYENIFVYELAKIAWVVLAYFMVYRFASLFLSDARAAVFSALFLLYPSHDATIFWFSSQYLTLTAAFYMYAFYLASRDRFWGAGVMATLASFVSYGSSPWAFGLSLIFLLQKRFRRALALLVPNLVYVAYYIAITKGLQLGNARIPARFELVPILKRFLLQIAGGVDAVVGPSFWLKTSYSVASLTLVSAAVGLAMVAVLIRGITRSPDEPPCVSRPVWLGLITVTFLGLGIFALAGGTYLQTVFGMGNRVTIYASLAAAFWLVCISRPPWAAAALSVALVFSTLGLSDHWKAWNNIQSRVVHELRADPQLAAERIQSDTLFIVGHPYSRLGPMAHVEFLLDFYGSDFVFQTALGERKTFKAVALRSRLSVESDTLVDPKSGLRQAIPKNVVVYDTETRQLRRMNHTDLRKFIAALQPPKRHWLQLVEIAWLRELILRWLPELSYLWREPQN